MIFNCQLLWHGPNKGFPVDLAWDNERIGRKNATIRVFQLYYHSLIDGTHSINDHDFEILPTIYQSGQDALKFCGTRNELN